MNTNASPWSISLIRGDLLFRFQRKLGLIPEQGLGIGRRAAILQMIVLATLDMPLKTVLKVVLKILV